MFQDHSTARRRARVRPGRRWRLLGPAFVAAIAYVDPGNIATNTTAGATLGFLLLWVVLLASLVAGPVQYLSARLGIVSGDSLPAFVAARSRSRVSRYAYWVQAELVAVATDIAEIIGGAVGLSLLFDLDLVVAGLITSVVAVGLLVARDRWGTRAFEVVCGSSLVVIGVCFALGIARVPPSLGDLAGGLVPSMQGSDAILLAAGIVGATIMPHAIYLHSALTSGTPTAPASVLDRLRVTRVDVALAMTVAGTVNVAMLVLGASALRSAESSTLEGAFADLADAAGSVASVAFAVALVVSGLSSTAVGTQAGAEIMRGLLHRQVPPLVRRAVTLVPTLAILALARDPLEVLVLSQVVLALGLPFALVPLLRASWVHRAGLSRVLLGVVAVASAAIIALDLALVWITVT